MKFLISIIIFIFLSSCTEKHQPVKTSSMENTDAKNNPYYSRTDTTKLTKNGKKYSLRIYMQSPGKQQQRGLSPENTMNSMK